MLVFFGAEMLHDCEGENQQKNKPDCDVHLQSTNWMKPNKLAGSLYLLRSNEKYAEGSNREGGVQHQKKGIMGVCARIEVFSGAHPNVQ